jgi:hypothetical protein
MKTVAEATTRLQMAPGDMTVGSRPAWSAPAGIDGDALRAEARTAYQALSEAEADLWRRAVL